MKLLKKAKGGQELILECPFCGKPKLYANPKKGVWYCFREGRGGKIGDLGDLPTSPSFKETENETIADKAYEQLIPVFDMEPKIRKIMATYLLNRGLTIGQIKRYAYYSPDEKYSGRVILRSPITQYWVARSFIPILSPPYLNPPVPKKPWITSKSEYYVVVEGVFDALAVERAGFPAIAILGNTVPASNLVWFQDKDLLILLDRDASGKAVALKFTLDKVARSVIIYLWDQYFSPLVKDPGESKTQDLKRILKSWR